jgi:hypothetical protein
MERPRLGDRIAPACSCDAEVVVPFIIALPRHAVVRIVSRGAACRHGHLPRQRVVVRSLQSVGILGRAAASSRV